MRCLIKRCFGLLLAAFSACITSSQAEAEVDMYKAGIGEAIEATFEVEPGLVGHLYIFNDLDEEIECDPLFARGLVEEAWRDYGKDHTWHRDDFETPVSVRFERV